MKLIKTQRLIENTITNRLYLVDSYYENLLTSISLFGILEPIIVFELPKGGFQIVSGNRRHRVALELGIDEVPCIIIEPIEITESLVSAHQEYRQKQPSDIIRELRILEDEFGLRQGTRSKDPVIQKAKEYKASLIKEHNKTEIDRLRQYDKKVRELVGDNTERYQKYLADLDQSKNISGQLKKVQTELDDRKNEKLTENIQSLEGCNYAIYNNSCENMYQLQNATVSTIVTSPPYFQLREYHNGVSKPDQLGQEHDVETYIQNLVNVFDEGYRVLKRDGSLFVNIADNIQNGRMLSVPHKFVNAMIDRGWILNDTILWSKVNPMYQIQKRTVSSHEYIFHFVKSIEFYYDRTSIQDVCFEPHELTYGENKQHRALRSNWKFDGSTLTTPTPNNHYLRKLCKEQGLVLSHSATFPKEIPLVAILTTSKPGDIAVDMFNGTGTTGEVALNYNRQYVGYELSKVYLKFSEIRLSQNHNTTTLTEAA